MEVEPAQKRCHERPPPSAFEIAQKTRIGTLDRPHRDPFDRMIVAQVIGARATLVTADRVILASAPTACVAVERS